MDNENISLQYESRALMDVCNLISSTCWVLTPDNPEVNANIIRSLNTYAEALRAETNNLQRLLDTYGHQ